MGWIEEALEETDRANLLRHPIALRHRSATRCELDSRELTVFCGNDYLGLRFDPRVAAAAAEAATRHGAGSGASRLVSGNTPQHEATERDLARFVGQPAALLTSSGFAANVGALPALAGADDVIFSDELNHASIVDGARLARARIAVYPHRNLAALAIAVDRCRPFRRGWVVTESVFSMDGDVADLVGLRAICNANELSLYVDEAHAIGIIGSHGAGLAVATNTPVEVSVGTLGKALGSSGAFVAGSTAMRMYLWNRSRSFVFSTGISPPSVAAAQTAAQIIRSDSTLMDRLRENVRFLRCACAEAKIPVGGDPRVPILPIVLTDERRALALSRALLADGLFVQAIRPPTVPVGTSRLRVTVSAAHSHDELEALVSSLRRHV